MSILTDPTNRLVIRSLLQDTFLCKKWVEFSDLLDVSRTDANSLEGRYVVGGIQMYELIRTLLENWKSEKGNYATVEKLVKILEDAKFKYAADLLRDCIKKASQVSVGSDGLMEVDDFEDIPPQKNGKTFSRGLQVQSLLDKGTFGAVYTTRHTFGTSYALKEVNVGGFLRRTTASGKMNAIQAFEKLIREVIIMGKLKNEPSFVAYYDAWFKGNLKKTFNKLLEEEDPETSRWMKANSLSITDCDNTFLYIKMELMNRNLDIYCREHSQSFGKGERVEIAKTVLEKVLHGLDVMHRKYKIIHRDLKPNNILVNLTSQGTLSSVKIGDFGLSREIEHPDTAVTRKVGGPLYASPEMERGDKYNFKTDIFSLGLIAVFILSDNYIERQMEKNFNSLRHGKICDTDICPIDKLEMALERKFDLLRTMLKRKAEERPSANEALRSLLSQAPQ